MSGVCNCQAIAIFEPINSHTNLKAATEERMYLQIIRILIRTRHQDSLFARWILVLYRFNTF